MVESGQSKVCSPMPEILLQILSGSKQFDPGFAPIKNPPGSDAYFFETTYSIFGWTD